MRLLSFFVFILLLAACTEKKTEEKEPLLTSSYNTEPGEWSSYSLKKSADAHSGNFIATIDSVSIYSAGYGKAIGEISKTPVSSVTFSYWILLKNDNAEAKTVLSIEDTTSKKNIVWVGNLVKQHVKENNKWTQITETFEIPKTIDPKCILKLYVLNASREEILLDDFKIAFY